jgi:hypothetical protein
VEKKGLGKCSVCGKSSFFLQTQKCGMCGKAACKSCVIELYDIAVTALDEPAYESKAYVCSDRCFENFAKTVEASAPKISSFQNQIETYLNKTLQTNESQQWFDSTQRDLINNKGAFSISKPSNPKSIALWTARELKAIQRMQETQQAMALQEAKQMETAGRFEDAANKYEALQMFEEAGRVRARAMSVVKTEIFLDVNKLLEKVGPESADVVYQCPHCGGKLKFPKSTSQK